MTETSTVNADQACQANQDCNYSIAGQICLDNKCTFSCKEDSDCISNGKCIGEKCDWSGETVPPLLYLNSTQNNLDTTNSSEKTTDNKLSSPFIIAIVVIVALVVIFCLAVVLFFVIRRKKLVESARGLKPLQLSSGSRTSIRKSKRDSRERERERSSKKYQHDDDIIGPEDEKEEHEDLFTPAAVGTHRTPPQRSQTMWGTSTPSTVELNVGYPTLGQQHHFMQQEHYMEMERDDQQQQQREEKQEE